MATLRQQMSRIWGWDPENIKESRDDCDLSRGDFLSFVSRPPNTYIYAPKYILILGIKSEYSWRNSADRLKYIAKVSDFTKPSEFSNHRIAMLEKTAIDRCTYKKSIKMVLKKL